jgi:hypothetical protein
MQESPAPMQPSFDRAAVCPRCGAGFACGAARPAATPCACAAIRLTGALRAALAERWGPCLCLVCLRAVAAGAAP